MPLIAGVLFTAMTLQETAVWGRDNNYKVYEQTKAVSLILQKTSDIERKARLFVLLADPSLRQPYERQSYETARASFRQALGELQRLSLNNKIVLLANELSEKEALIYQQIVESDTSSHPRLPVDQAFVALREAATALSLEFESHVDLEFNQLRQQSKTLEQGLLVQLGMLLGISIALVYGLLVYLERSIRQLDSSIRRLGTGNLDGLNTISGPVGFTDMGRILETLRMRLLEFERLKQSVQHAGADETVKLSGELSEQAAQPESGERTLRVLENIDDQSHGKSKEPPAES